MIEYIYVSKVDGQLEIITEDQLYLIHLYGEEDIFNYYEYVGEL